MTRRFSAEQLSQEANLEPAEFICPDGTLIPLAPFLPASFALQVARLASGTLDVAAEEQAFMATVEAIAGEQADKLLASIDLYGLQMLITQCYGMSLGESSASGASLQSDGNGSRQT